MADRIDAIYAWLKSEGLHEQFHPSYTRMVPAHYVLEIQLVGCPDPDRLARQRDDHASPAHLCGHPARSVIHTARHSIAQQAIAGCSRIADAQTAGETLRADRGLRPIGVDPPPREQS